MTFGEWLRREREAKRWTQEDLAEASGVHQTTISKLERTRREPRPASTDRKRQDVVRLADALGADVAEALRVAGLDAAPPLPPDLAALVEALLRLPEPLRRRYVAALIEQARVVADAVTGEGE